MTHLEKYSEDIAKIACSGELFGVMRGNDKQCLGILRIEKLKNRAFCIEPPALAGGSFVCRGIKTKTGGFFVCVRRQNMIK